MRMLALGLGVIMGLVALAPARLLLPAPPLAATSVTGSLWQAQLSGAALGRMQLGDVALALQPGALLKGRLSWQDPRIIRDGNKISGDSPLLAETKSPLARVRV